MDRRSVSSNRSKGAGAARRNITNTARAIHQFYEKVYKRLLLLLPLSSENPVLVVAYPAFQHCKYVNAPTCIKKFYARASALGPTRAIAADFDCCSHSFGMRG
jgi:hypothetical protein